MKHLISPLRNERGVAVPLVAVFFTAILGLAAVGVDTGRVASVANEAQNAADIAAMAAIVSMASNNNENEREAAENALSHNLVNGGVATAALQALEKGYIGPDYTFTPGALPYNAVRARAGATVSNILLRGIGFPQSVVTRQAIAAFAGIGSGIPTLPIVIGECNFNSECYHQSCMPYLARVPDTTDNSAWTAFFESASNNNIEHYFPSPCGGNYRQTINVGNIINLGNGEVTPLLGKVQCLLNNGVRVFTIPIVECVGAFNQAKKVVGFAKVEVDYVVATGSPKGIWLHGLYEGKQPGPPGGGQFGLLTVSLVK